MAQLRGNYASVFCFVIASYLSFKMVVSRPDSMTSYDKLYDLGMDAYKLEKWSKCVSFLQSAIDDYHFYKNAVIDCRLKCKKKGKSTLNSDMSEEIIELSVFTKLLENSNCLRRCKKKKLGSRPEIPVTSSVDSKFEKRTPYNYLQFCLYKLEDYKKMAAAAYTYFITNQADERVIDNIQYYRGLPDLTDADFIDLERKPYQTAYVKGLNAYDKGEWKSAAEKFEESLTLYYAEEERCLAGCEDWYSHSGYPDFTNAVADHLVVVLICQRRCQDSLSIFGVEKLENFVSEHYNYLQFSYYNMKDYDKAVQAVASFLLFHPTDQEMLTNKDYYISELRFHEGHFTPHEAAVKYVKYWNQIGKMLDFIRDKYTLPRDKIVNDEDEDEAEESSAVGGVPSSTETEQKTPHHYMKRFAKLGIQLFAESEQLNGPLRFAADEFFREDQCISMAGLVDTKPADKTGVSQITIPEIIELVKSDGDYEVSLRLLMKASEIARHYTATYFNQSALFISDLKVICREGGDKWEKELPEDCIPQEDGSCRADLTPEEKTDTEFLTVGYLSDVEDGTGHIYFMDEDKHVQSSVNPQCGRLVGFATSNIHGVNLSWKQRRCALFVKTSSDRSKEYTSLRAAGEMLSGMIEARTLTEVNNTEILNEFARQGVVISQTGKDLKGKERFAADGLALTEECQELISMAQVGAVSGDGYKAGDFPTSDGEDFSGLGISRAVQTGTVVGDGYGKSQDKPEIRGSRFVSPYSKHEIFGGLNVTRALKLVEEGILSSHSVRLLLDLSEQGRLLVEKYFNLTKPLYFDFTHLVCRTAVEGTEFDGEFALSHPVHADNCMIHDDGSCVQDVMSFIQRHYSAILYLNDDFEGGEFFFANKDLSEQASVKPKCGRLVGFNSGEYHGVKGVQKGQRCAVAMWYTMDPNHQEVSRIQAARALDKMVQEERDLSEETESDSIGSLDDLGLSSIQDSHDEL